MIFYILRPEELQDGFLVVKVNSSETNPEGKIVRVFVSYDMGWSQRGNGYTYDSLNGYCAIIGLKTGKILDYTTRNLKCRICDVSKMQNRPPREHDCRLNFFGSAKAMEADGAVELITSSQILKEANCEIAGFIGDNDSCSKSSVEDKSNHAIIKLNDMNHSKKGISKLLWLIHGDKKKDPDQELDKDMIKYLTDAFAWAVKQNAKSVKDIRSAFLSITPHVYGEHILCINWCKRAGQDDPNIRLRNSILRTELENFFEKLGQQAQQFLGAASSQANEAFNHSVCSKMPKTMCYSTSESGDFRVSATAAQKNKTEIY